MATAILVVLFVAGVLASVAIHELGHLVTARKFKMAVSDFSVGFGKPLLTWRRNGIAYRLRLLPLGGFVKIHGMRPGDTLPEKPNGVAYVDRPAWQRAVVTAAGPGANVVFAWVLLAVMLLALPIGQLTTEIADRTGGLQPGDRVVAVDGSRVDSRDALAASLEGATGAIETTVERDGRLVTATVASGEALAGALVQETARLGVGDAAAGATGLVGMLAKEQTVGIARALAPENLSSQLQRGFGGEARTGDEGVMSIVGLGQAVAQQADGQQAELAGLWLLFVLAALNLVLALINLIPVTPLDGGHFALAVVEGGVSKLRRIGGAAGSWFLPRPVVNAVTYGTFVLVLGLGFTLIALDLVNPIQLAG